MLMFGLVIWNAVNLMTNQGPGPVSTPCRDTGRKSMPSWHGFCAKLGDGGVTPTWTAVVGSPNFSSISPLCLVNISHTLETHPCHPTQGPPFEKRCQDYLLGYMCFRCDKVKQSNYKALPAGSNWVSCGARGRLQVIWSTSKGNKIICLVLSICGKPWKTTDYSILGDVKSEAS